MKTEDTWQFCDRDLFGMVSSRDPFNGESWPPTFGDQVGSLFDLMLRCCRRWAQKPMVINGILWDPLKMAWNKTCLTGVKKKTTTYSSYFTPFITSDGAIMFVFPGCNVMLVPSFLLLPHMFILPLGSPRMRNLLTNRMTWWSIAGKPSLASQLITLFLFRIFWSQNK